MLPGTYGGPHRGVSPSQATPFPSFAHRALSAVRPTRVALDWCWDPLYCGGLRSLHCFAVRERMRLDDTAASCCGAQDQGLMLGMRPYVLSTSSLILSAKIRAGFGGSI
jgi:hypothetical protein